ncbi:response regulator [Bdellovibrio svalbardensis]|uniref:Response regulator n=1 Tax=Bdellovibrio svalbardensis TaxID=2972972 RepID=A0ABT6DJ11_9BACT|nr:response regulator [Bdellovibrio svalbardensis]MDG0815851.1 response regulator [Bdellovibrio svalbardensis]
MALRVLLADESSTIKKVMQLALSDFAVDVKSVPVGLDVLGVAKSFKPDIVFADVLLAKKNGYEVSFELKNDPETANIPVVLMWSGFMEVDESKITQSGANGRLEKPFDADHLRNLVNTLVKKASTNPVSSFLSFPDMPDFEETPAEAIPAVNTESGIYAIPEDSAAGFDAIPVIEDEDVNPLELPDEEFSAVPLTSPKAEEEHDEGGWAHQDLTKFKINIPEAESSDFASKFVIPQDDDLANAHFEVSGDFEEVSFHENEAMGPDLTQKPSATKPAPAAKAPASESAVAQGQRAATPRTAQPVSAQALVSTVSKSVKDQMMESLKKGPSAAQPNTQSQGDMKADMMEKIVREEAREMIEAICWKVIPEIAERIVREEINKILRDTDKSI